MLPRWIGLRTADSMKNTYQNDPRFERALTFTQDAEKAAV